MVAPGPRHRAQHRVGGGGDGLRIYFNSNRPGGKGGQDLYVAQRATRSAPFGPPKSLTAVQSTADEGDPWLSPDERVIVFSSSRNGTLDLFEAER